MKKLVLVVLALGLTAYLVGCGKKQEPITENQEPISMEDLGKMSTTTQTAPEVMAKQAPAVTVTPASTVPMAEVKVPEAKLEKLPPSGPYKPTTRDVQTALKNAGFYTGKVDGKSGPMTKKAIEDFQKANNLSADGKVGPKTWSLLSKHLTVEPKPAN